MQLTTIVLITGLLTGVSAHFQLQYPLPRGAFVEKSEPNFCDGYTNAVDNRTSFPISGGFFSINSEHPQWTLGGIVATVQNPASFNSFKDSSNNFQQFLPYFETTGEGAFCAPINLTASGISGITDGANVTLQFIFDGGDGMLYQCADLTLSANATIPSSVSCTNSTNAAVTPVSSSVSPGPSSTSSSSSGTSAGSNSSSTNGALGNAAVGYTGFAGLVGAAIALL